MGWLGFHTGSTRRVICIGRRAFKMPRLKRFGLGRRGILQEIDRYATHHRDVPLCPIHPLLPWGLLAVMPRCKAYNRAVWSLERDAAPLVESEIRWVTRDLRLPNVGLLDRRLVLLDYADN